MPKNITGPLTRGFECLKRFCLWCSNHLIKVILLWQGLLFCAAIIYWLVEAGRSVWDGIWCAWITGLSIGYGDQFPITPVGRTTFMIWGFVSIMIIAPTIIGLILEHLIKNLDLFSDIEQRLVMARLESTEEAQKVILRDNEILFEQNRLIMAAVSGARNPDVVNRFEQLALPSRDHLRHFWTESDNLEEDEERETKEEDC